MERNGLEWRGYLLRIDDTIGWRGEEWTGGEWRGLEGTGTDRTGEERTGADRRGMVAYFV